MANNQAVGNKFLMSLYVIWGLWYVFFDASIKLRPYYQYLWPAMVVVGLIFSFQTIIHGNSEIRKNTRFFIVFLVLCFFSMLFSYDVHESILYIQRIALAYGFALVVTSRSYDKIIINAIILFCVFMLLVSLIQLYLPPVYYAVFLPLVNEDAELLQSGLRQGLAVGLTNGTSQNGLIMSIGFLPCAAYAIFKKERRLLYLLLAIGFFLMTFATGKRSYSIIIVLELFSMLLMKFQGTNTGKRVFNIFLVIVFVVFLFSILSEYIPEISAVADKFRELNDEGDVTNGRIEHYRDTWTAYENNGYSPLGINALRSVLGFEAHNSYLQWIVEFGLILCWFPIYYMVRIPFNYSKKILYQIKNSTAEDALVLVIPYIFICQLLASAFVAIPFQWHHVMTLFFIFQLLLLRNHSNLLTR